MVHVFSGCVPTLFEGGGQIERGETNVLTGVRSSAPTIDLVYQAVTPTVAMAAVDYGFTQSAQKASLLNTFMVALKLIKSEEPVADLDDAALEGIWKMVLLWKTKRI